MNHFSLECRDREWDKGISIEVTCLNSGKNYKFNTLTEARKSLGIYFTTLKN